MVSVLNTGGVCQGFSANGEIGQVTLHPDPVAVSLLQILMGRTTMQQHYFLVMAAIQSLDGHPGDTEGSSRERRERGWALLSLSHYILRN